MVHAHLLRSLWIWMSVAIILFAGISAAARPPPITCDPRYGTFPDGGHKHCEMARNMMPTSWLPRTFYIGPKPFKEWGDVYLARPATYTYKSCTIMVGITNPYTHAIRQYIQITTTPAYIRDIATSIINQCASRAFIPQMPQAKHPGGYSHVGVWRQMRIQVYTEPGDDHDNDGASDHSSDSDDENDCLDMSGWYKNCVLT